MKRHLGLPEFRPLVALSLLTRVKSSSARDKAFDGVLRKLNRHYPGKTLLELKAAGDKLWEFLSKAS